MSTTVLNHNYFQKSYRKLIQQSKVAGIVWLLQKVYPMQKYRQMKKDLQKLPKGTVGRELSNLLVKNQLDFIPKYESHDLKHLILGYGMNPEDEVKMQAYLLGNGCYSISCVLFLSFALLMPEVWSDLKTEFLKGRKSVSIIGLKVENCVHLNLRELKTLYRSEK